MKPITNQERKDAQRMVYAHAFDSFNIFLNRKFKADRRTRVGKLALSFYNELTIDRVAIAAKQKQSKYITPILKVANSRPLKTYEQSQVC